MKAISAAHSLAIGALGAMLLIGAGLFSSAPIAHAAERQAKEKVVIQVSDGDPKTWNQALNVVKNIQQAYGKGNVEVEVVAFGNGIGMVKMESEVGNRIGDTLKSGAHVYACQNTMRGRKLAKEDMLDGIGYVKAGVIEIIEKQRQGWAILRP